MDQHDQKPVSNIPDDLEEFPQDTDESETIEEDDQEPALNIPEDFEEFMQEMEEFGFVEDDLEAAILSESESGYYSEAEE